MSNGKGDTYRPVNRKVYEENYDRIFNKGKHEHHTPEQTAEAFVNVRCPECGHDFCNCPCCSREARD